MRLLVAMFIIISFVPPNMRASERKKTGLKLTMGIELNKNSSNRLTVVCRCVNNGAGIMEIPPFMIGNNALLITPPKANRYISLAELQAYKPVIIKPSASKLWMCNNLLDIFKKIGIYTVQWSVESVGSPRDSVKSSSLRFLCVSPSSNLPSLVSSSMVVKKQDDKKLILRIFPLVTIKNKTINKERVSFFTGDILFALANLSFVKENLPEFGENGNILIIESLEDKNQKHKLDFKKDNFKTISTASTTIYKLNVKEELENLSLKTGFYKIKWRVLTKNECSLIVYWENSKGQCSAMKDPVVHELGHFTGD